MWDLLKKAVAASLCAAWMSSVSAVPAAQVTKENLAQIMKSAEGGDISSQIGLGYAYFAGEILKKDPEKGLHWLTQAAEGGDTDTMNTLGALYSQGTYIPKDTQKAIYWLDKAATLGSTIATYNLGVFYLAGIGVPKDVDKALVYFQRAANEEHPDALYGVGFILTTQEGRTPEEVSRGVALLNKALELGSASAMHALGTLYRHGRGVPLDKLKAKTLYEKAAASGNDQAKVDLEIMTQELKSASKESPLLSDMRSAHQSALAQQEAADDDRKRWIEVNGALGYKLGLLHHQVFERVKGAGLELGDPKADMKEVNRGRKNVGVWEISVYETDIPGFIQTNDFGRITYAFSLKGYGLVSIDGYVRDKNFESNGRFSPGCMYEVFIASKSKKYKCEEFLAGTRDDEIVEDLLGLLTQEIQSWAQRQKNG